jgi:hypothetical protein
MAEWMSQADYARHAGVHPATVCRWIQRGRITCDARGRINPEQADMERALSESDAPHHQARKAQIDEAKAAAGNAPPPDAAEILQRLKFATMREREAKAEAAALALDQQAGLLLERAEVELMLADFGATLRTLAEGMADRLAPVVAGRSGDVGAIHADIDAAARDLLQEISAHMARAVERQG